MAQTTPTLNKFTGRPYGQSINNITKLGEALSVDLTSPGSTALYPIPTGCEAVVAYVTVSCAAATSVTVVASAKVETVADILLPDQPLIGLDAADKVWMWPFPAGKTSVSIPGTTISLVVTSGATATNQTADVRLYGYLV